MLLSSGVAASVAAAMAVVIFVSTALFFLVLVVDNAGDVANSAVTAGVPNVIIERCIRALGRSVWKWRCRPLPRSPI